MQIVTNNSLLLSLLSSSPFHFVFSFFFLSYFRLLPRSLAVANFDLLPARDSLCDFALYFPSYERNACREGRGEKKLRGE